LTPWWGGSFDPGAAIADIMTNQLVNAGPYNVIDRQHIQQIEAEQEASKSGDVSPATESRLGHMLGANYLIFGRVEQFDKTGGSSGGLGGLGGGLLGGGGIKTQKLTLHVTMRIVEANTGRIVATADDSESKSGTSFALGGAGATGGAGYSSSDFTSSTVGQLITLVAGNLVKQMDPTKLVAAPPGPSINAKVLGKDGDSIIINAGTNKGVTVGTYFTIYQVKIFKDPDTGKSLESHIKRGTIQILSVDSATATGKLVDGVASTLDAAISGGE
jgi:curli biogenesis system outer membrane secretion channel CsgG